MTDVYIQTTKASNVGIGGEKETRRHESDYVSRGIWMYFILLSFQLHEASIALLSILGEESFTCDSL